jgi:hypothetical protein
MTARWHHVAVIATTLAVASCGPDDPHGPDDISAATLDGAPDDNGDEPFEDDNDLDLSRDFGGDPGHDMSDDSEKSTDFDDENDLDDSGNFAGEPDEPDTEPDVPPTGCAPDQVDINTADEQQLQNIIHIVEAKAPEVIRLRPFDSVADLELVDGIGPVLLGDIIDQGVACVAE